MNAALVVYSGGLDSYTLLHKALKTFESVHAVTFNYGQKHKKEIDFAASNCASLGVPHKIINLDLDNILSDSALVGDSAIPEGNYNKDLMKMTVVPNRNMIMISIAASLAIKEKISYLWYAAHSGDHEIYPDCRPDFINKLKEVLKVCDYHEIQFEAPFQHLSKANIIAEGQKMNLNYALSWTCYEGKEKPCLKCSACLERLAAFKKNGLQDPLIDVQD